MKTFAFVLAAIASSTAMAQDTGAACASQLSPLQARIYQKAVDGPGALRDFVYMRRGVLQLDVTEAADWAASVTQERATCMKKVAQARPAPVTL
jgi:hypothetical protein